MQSMHGAALGLVNWGIYFGYGISFIVGKYVPSLDILGQVSPTPGILARNQILNSDLIFSFCCCFFLFKKRDGDGRIIYLECRVS